jgi:hypothetical protein
MVRSLGCQKFILPVNGKFVKKRTVFMVFSSTQSTEGTIHEGGKGPQKMHRSYYYNDFAFISFFPLCLFPYLHPSFGINQFRMLKDFITEIGAEEAGAVICY